MMHTIAVAGRPTKHNIAMDRLTGNRVAHPYLRVDTFGQPTIIADGKIAGALSLDGNGQYASLGRQFDACLGNLDLCRHGMLLAAWIKPGQLRDGMDLISSGANGIKARIVNGQVRSRFFCRHRVYLLTVNFVRCLEDVSNLVSVSRVIC